MSLDARFPMKPPHDHCTKCPRIAPNHGRSRASRANCSAYRRCLLLESAMTCAKTLLGAIDLDNPEVLFCARCGEGPCVQATWRGKVTAERERLGRDLTLDELLALARTHDLTEEEIAAQRASWARQEKD